jgi:hypothetical protein
MKSIVKFFDEMFRGVKGETSSKRVITFIAFICIVVAFLCNIFMSIPLEEHIFDGMLYLVMSGMGLTAFEKFSPRHAHSSVPSESNVNNEYVLSEEQRIKGE